MDTAVTFPTSPKAVKAVPLKLSKRMSVEQAFQAIVHNCIGQVQANEVGVIKFHGVESLHQMRVGLRRLRSALSMFDELVQLSPQLRGELEWLAEQLGPARDWDVLAESTLARVAQAVPMHLEIDEVKQAALAKTHTLHDAAALAVSSERYAALMHALQRWVNEREWREMLSPHAKTHIKMPIAAFARATLEKDQQRLKKRGRKLGGASVAARHRVRIAAKKTRYAAEFFGSLYPGKQVRPYVKALARLQDELGWINDAAVGERLLGELAESRTELKNSTEFVRGYLAGSIDVGAEQLRKAWKNFAPLAAPN